MSTFDDVFQRQLAVLAERAGHRVSAASVLRETKRWTKDKEPIAPATLARWRKGEVDNPLHHRLSALARVLTEDDPDRTHREVLQELQRAMDLAASETGPWKHPSEADALPLPDQFELDRLARHLYYIRRQMTWTANAVADRVLPILTEHGVAESTAAEVAREIGDAIAVDPSERVAGTDTVKAPGKSSDEQTVSGSTRRSAGRRRPRS